MPKFEGTILVADQQFWIQPVEPGFDPSEVVAVSSPGPHPLAAIGHRALMIMTGIANGPVHVEVVVVGALTDASDELREWEEVSEVSIDFQAQAVMIGALGVDAPEALSSIPLAWPGDTLVKVHCSGRSVDFDGVAQFPHERYLVTFSRTTPLGYSAVHPSPGKSSSARTTDLASSMYRLCQTVDAHAEIAAYLAQGILSVRDYDGITQGQINATNLRLHADEVELTLADIARFSTGVTGATLKERGLRFSRLCRETAGRLEACQSPSDTPALRALLTQLVSASSALSLIASNGTL